MTAFIVRPFGKKKDVDGEEIDFDLLEAQLIDPALTMLEINGRTTGEILAAGNIRTDMFQKLLTADVVIADVSLHNANVFYELGIRHALREKRTFLLRCKSAGQEIPFDLKTDRYFTYDRKDPAAILDKFVQALRETLDSNQCDSPVFQQLPNLKAQDPSRFLVVPADFREEVIRAGTKKQIGDLNLLAAEANGFEWEVEGLRLVGRAQYDLKAYEGAKTTWEAIREVRPQDSAANLLLGTIYERLNDYVASDQAIQRALEQQNLDAIQRAEAHALQARNAKTHWREEWSQSPETEQRVSALRSAYLMKSFEQYELGFQQDLNHYFSGLNAAGMLTIIIELAKANPEVWSESFDSATDAQAELERLKIRLDRLCRTVEYSLQAQAERLKSQGIQDIWFEISRADLYCLTGKNPKRVAQEYREALVNAQDFYRDAAGNQLAIYEQLGVLRENVAAALGVVGSRGRQPEVKAHPRVLVFTGHRMDSPERKAPRFPADKELIAREAIKKVVQDELASADGKVVGIAGGASGGDILFHEVCAELEVPTQLFLALPQDQYCVASVQSAGPTWIERYNDLCQRLPPRILGPSRELARWLRPKQNYDIWRRTNLWMLHNAIALGGTNVTLIALWDGQGGDGPGGTEDMFENAKQRGAKPIILDTKQLFGISDAK
jgi:hypothetical protein